MTLSSLTTEITTNSQPLKRARVRTATVTLDDFFQLQEPHPYGVLPGGNRFFAEGSTASDSSSSPTDTFNEECWDAVLSFCTGPDLGRISQTCCFLYVAAHQPELWRDLVLRRSSAETLSKWGPTWKDTFVLLQHPEGRYRPHTPIRVRGVYSDHYYRLHYCRSFALPGAWMNNEDNDSPWAVPRVLVSEMSTKKFVEEFEGRNQPVVVQAAACSWRAFEKWKEPSYCEQHTAGRSFRATSGMAPLPAQFTWKSYQEYCVGSAGGESRLCEEGPLYLFDRTTLQPGSDLHADYMADLKRTCPYWDPELPEGGHDLFGLLGEGRRPDHTWLIVGGRRSGSVFHLDPNGTHAWNAAICGRKRWIFYPPGITPPGVHPSEDGDEVALPLSIGEWLFQFWEEHCERRRIAPVHERPLECTAMPGDVVFVPHGWWHMVINLDELNIAITHNYVSLSNLSNVLKFLNINRDQVSGCRDRGESIKPERLYEEFVEAMKHQHPKWLEKALAEPDWTCRAWTKKIDTTDATEQQQPKEKPPCSTKTSLSVMEKAKQGSDNGFSFSFV